MAQSRSNRLRSTLAGGHDYIFDICCDLCKQQGNYVEATGYCSDCQDYLCSECFNYHLIPKPMRHHVLLDQHQMPKDQQQRGGDICTEACAAHPHKTVEYFCTQHDELGCTVCVTLNHRNCKGVENIPDIASNILSSVGYAELKEKVTHLTQSATTAIQTSQDQAKLSKTYHTNALEDFKQFKTDVSKAVNRIEKNLIKEADVIKGDDEKMLKSLENKYKDVLKDIQALSSKFTSLQNNGQFCQMFIAMKRARWEIDTIETTIGDPDQNIQARNYRLITNKEVRVLLVTPETMVRLEVVKQARPGSHSREGKKTRAQHIMDIELDSGDANETSTITGCIVLPGDNLVVVDRNNDNVKLIDLTRNKIVSQLELEGTLSDITLVGSTQAVVTSYNTQTIYVVNVKAKQLKLGHEVKVKGQCRGIASINDKLVVSFDEPVKVEIISMEGKELHTVIPEDKGGMLFNNPWYVAVSKDKQSLYISDHGRGTVTSVDLTGQVQATYEDDKLWGPRGLTVDSAGRVYICGELSDNIMQLTAELTEVQELQKRSEGVVKPYSVCYCEATDRLYIGMWDSYIVKVYQLN